MPYIAGIQVSLDPVWVNWIFFILFSQCKPGQIYHCGTLNYCVYLFSMCLAPSVGFNLSVSYTRFIRSGAPTGVSTAPTSCGVSSLRESSVQVTHEHKHILFFTCTHPWCTLSVILDVSHTNRWKKRFGFCSFLFFFCLLRFVRRIAPPLSETVTLKCDSGLKLDTSVVDSSAVYQEFKW